MMGKNYYCEKTLRNKAKEIGFRVKKDINGYSLISDNGEMLFCGSHLYNLDNELKQLWESITGKKF